MKRTNNMIYRATEESKELTLALVNDGEFYDRFITPVINNLSKKLNKGIYDTDKAVDAWYPVATEYAKKYAKLYGGRFTVQHRFTTAVELEEYFREDVEEGVAI